MLRGVGHPPAQRGNIRDIRGSGSDFGVASSGFGGKSINCSGYCTIGIRDCNFGIFGDNPNNCSGSGSSGSSGSGCNSNSEQQHLLLKIGVFGIGVGNNCSGSGSLPAGHTGVFPGSSPAASPAARRNPVPGDLTRTIVHAPRASSPGPVRKTTRTIVRNCPGGPAASARRPALIKKFILGVDILYNMG